jgi:hypothetical protein
MTTGMRRRAAMLLAMGAALACAALLSPEAGATAASDAPALTVSPSHGSGSSSFRATYTRHGSCGTHPSIELYWNQPYPHGVDLGSASTSTVNGTCVASKTAEPPPGSMRAPGTHALYGYLNVTSGSFTYPDTSTQASTTYVIDPSPTPSPSVRPCASPSASTRASPSPSPTRSPSSSPSGSTCQGPAPRPSTSSGATAAKRAPTRCLPDPDFPTLCTTARAGFPREGATSTLQVAQADKTGSPDRTGYEILMGLVATFAMGCCMIGASVAVNRGAPRAVARRLAFLWTRRA